jgi:hypothetical protein
MQNNSENLNSTEENKTSLSTSTNNTDTANNRNLDVPSGSQLSFARANQLSNNTESGISFSSTFHETGSNSKPLQGLATGFIQNNYSTGLFNHTTSNNMNNAPSIFGLTSNNAQSPFPTFGDKKSSNTTSDTAPSLRLGSGASSNTQGSSCTFGDKKSSNTTSGTAPSLRLGSGTDSNTQGSSCTFGGISSNTTSGIAPVLRLGSGTDSNTQGSSFTFGGTSSNTTSGIAPVLRLGTGSNICYGISSNNIQPLGLGSSYNNILQKGGASTTDGLFGNTGTGSKVNNANSEGILNKTSTGGGLFGNGNTAVGLNNTTSNTFGGLNNNSNNCGLFNSAASCGPINTNTNTNTNQGGLFASSTPGGLFNNTTNNTNNTANAGNLFNGTTGLSGCGASLFNSRPNNLLSAPLGYQYPSYYASHYNPFYYPGLFGCSCGLCNNHLSQNNPITLTFNVNTRSGVFQDYVNRNKPINLQFNINLN